jgi:hypothetical protein
MTSKLREDYPAVRDLLRVLKALREESNRWRYGAWNWALSGMITGNRVEVVTLQSSTPTATVPGNEFAGLQVGMWFHVSPPATFLLNYGSIVVTAAVSDSSWAPDPSMRDLSAVRVQITFNNTSADTVTFDHTGIWTYAAVMPQGLSIDGETLSDPDSGIAMPTISTSFGG